MITPTLETNRSARYRKGFTLLELLLVMAVMMILMSLVVVAFPSVGRAGNLTNGAGSFVDQMNAARQAALAQNRVVEVRFYYLPGPTDGSTATAYRAMRTIICNSNGGSGNYGGASTAFYTDAKPGNIQRLPSGVIIYSDTTGKFTTVLPSMTNSSTPTASWPTAITTGSTSVSTGTETFPGNTQVTYASFQFKPSGGTSLSTLGTTAVSGQKSDKWFMSFKNQTDPVDGTIRPAKNFVTVLIDPLSGRVRTYRP